MQAKDNVLSEKSVLLKKIQMYDFCLTEVSLYLDTHPTCINALEYFKKYNDMKKTACAEYAEKYGPLSISAVNNTQNWTWVSAPWPWERGE